MTLIKPYSASFYVGDNETKEFPFTFDEVSESFVKVLVSHADGSVSIPTYTVDMDLKQVVFGDDTPAPSDDDIVCVYRATPVIQDTPFRTLQGYNAQALENILSKIVAMIQEIKSTYFSTQVLQGDPWQLDLLKSEDDGATVNIDYVAKKLVKGLYFRINNGNLQVSADGSSYITMPKSSDIVEFRQVQTVLPDLTVQYRLQYRIGNEWFNAESNAEATADEALRIAEEARDTADDAKDIAQDASDKVDGFDDRITQAEQDASDAKDIAQEALDKVTQEITDREDADSALQEQIDDLSGRGRFLALWNCATGLAESNPPESPYLYKAGDYFVVGTVSSADPVVNYKPDGSSYTTGVASTTVETNEVSVNDTYFYDGTVWKLQSNAQKEVSFSALAGRPYDNTNLSNALNAKANASRLTAHTSNTNNPHEVTKAQVGLGNVDNTSDLNKPISTATQTALDLKADKSTTYTKTETDTLLGAKQDTISDLATIRSNAQAGKAASDTIATYGNIVTHNVSEFATAAQGTKADTAVQPGNLATVATTGSYNDLTDTPVIPSMSNRVNGAPLSNLASVFYGTSSTAAATVDKVVSIPSITTLDVGTVIVVQPTVTSTVANSTIKLNNFSAYPMRYNNTAITTSTDSIVWNAAYPSVWVFDGTYWRFVAHGIDTDTTYGSMSVSEGTTGTATSNRVVRANYLKQIIQGTTLTGIDVATTGAVTATDTITDGIGKLQATKANIADLATVATSGSYNDLSDKPTIPTVNNSTITITQGGVTKGSFTLNQASGDTIALDAGGSGSYHPDLFDVKWADHICNDVQWLRADTFSWQSGSVYQVAYQHLEDDIDGKTLQSETISGTTIQFYLADDGHKICPASEESNVSAIYAATGVAWYYIIDTVNTRFKLPRTQFAFTGIRNGVGEFVEAGLPNITGSFATAFIGNPQTGVYSGAFTSTKYNSGQGAGSNNSWSGYYNLDASRSSSIYGNSDTVQPKATEMYLYFYVGNFTQTALENTAGITTEEMNNKVNIGHEVIEFQEPTAANNYTWYRKYRDGWVEQGGNVNGGTSMTATFPIEMADAHYTVAYGNMSGTYEQVRTDAKTTTSITIKNSNGGGTVSTDWQVSGMAA